MTLKTKSPDGTVLASDSVKPRVPPFILADSTRPIETVSLLFTIEPFPHSAFPQHGGDCTILHIKRQKPSCSGDIGDSRGGLDATGYAQPGMSGLYGAFAIQGGRAAGWRLKHLGL